MKNNFKLQARIPTELAEKLASRVDLYGRDIPISETVRECLEAYISSQELKKSVTAEGWHKVVDEMGDLFKKYENSKNGELLVFKSLFSEAWAAIGNYSTAKNLGVADRIYNDDGSLK